MTRIEELRKAAHLTQQELADLIGIDRSTIAKWETNGIMPRPKTLKKLAAVFNCRMGDLLEEAAS